MKPTRFGKYLLIDQISRGGMAEVYLGKATGALGFERVVALKRILPLIAEDPDFQTMFIDEAKISSSLTHANIGQVFEFGQIGDTYFLTMEYISGKDIRRIRGRLAERKRHMAVPMALYIGSQLCKALDHAHRLENLQGESMQIVHRDISPPNVVVSYRGEVKLIDFGIARARSRITRTRTGKLKGKFAYMSPEQVEGVPLDHRSDIFSAGTLLFEMLTHQRPFRGDNEIAVMNAIRDASCPPPSAINPDVPLAVDEIVMKALSRDREERFQWASELSEAIEGYNQRTQGDFAAPQLAAWMNDAFAKEIEHERGQLRALQELTPEQCEESLVEEEEEADTIADLRGPGALAGVLGGDAGLGAEAVLGDDEEDPEDGATELMPGPGDTKVTPNPSAEVNVDTARESLAPPAGMVAQAARAGAQQAVAPPSAPADTGGAGEFTPRPPESTDPDRLDPSAIPEPPLGEQTNPDAHVDMGMAAPHDHDTRRHGPIYPDGSTGVVGGAVDIDTDPSARRPGAEIVDARDPHRGERAVEVDGPAEVFTTRRDNRSQPSLPAISDATAARGQATMVAAPPPPAPPPADFVGKVRYYALHVYRKSRQRFDRLGSTQVIMVAGGATAVLLLLIVALAATCGGDDGPRVSKVDPGTMGSVLVTTSESVSCTVKLDGRTHGLLSGGNTLTIANITPGSHIVSLRCHGYRPYSTSVKVKPGEVALVDAPLKRE